MALDSMVTSITDRNALLKRFQSVRQLSLDLAGLLSPEDCQIQSMPDASPTKWHLAHTSWFYETFILVPHLKGYTRLNEEFNYLYNSYYNGIGEQFSRPKRGLVTRPPLSAVIEYRQYIDKYMAELLADEAHPHADEIAYLAEMGTHHEQQHQELILSDIKHAFSLGGENVIYKARKPEAANKAEQLTWFDVAEGLYEIGHDSAKSGFAFDNEGPRHKIWLDGFQLASRLVTNGEYLRFIEDGGYSNPDLWLSEGWYFLAKKQRQHPGYWQKRADGWYQYTLSGWLPLNMEESVCHVTFYEAQAYAMWAGGRLPTEQEWEVAAQLAGTIDDSSYGRFHPQVAQKSVQGASPLLQMIGDVWQWTLSSYAPYPGFETLKGVVGEYNGKFMCNQYVLRGGSCITSPEHVRLTYRNFFPSHIDWQFTGIRLAKNNG